jgi:MFS family permease
MFIKDMFFFHEHARKINIWSGSIVVSPYMGPLLAAFIVNTQIWQWAFGVYAIETGLCLIATILFVDETYYDRKTVQPELVPNGPRWQRMLGIQQIRSGYIRNTWKDAVMRPLVMIVKPVVFISVIYYMLTFAWVVGINTTLSILLTPVYGFGPKAVGTFCSPSDHLYHPKLMLSRLLLLHPHRRRHPWRNCRPLATRPNRESLHGPQQRTLRA